MKRIIFAACFLISIQGIAQDIYKFRAKEYKYLMIDEKFVARAWTPVDILIVYNKENGTIKIFSEEDQTFDIISKSSDHANGGDWLDMYCSDSKDRKCNIHLVKWDEYSKSEPWAVIVEYSDQSWMYGVELIEK
jgi:hypothetical protein